MCSSATRFVQLGGVGVGGLRQVALGLWAVVPFGLTEGLRSCVTILHLTAGGRRSADGS